MINRKILASLVVIGVVGAVAGSGTLAYFSDTETSEDNTFTAGSVNAYFATVDSAITLDDGETLDDFFDQDGEDTTFIVEGDVKPGDVYERTMAIAVTDNPSHVCLAVTDVQDNENDLIEPEEQAGDASENDGELGDNLEMRAWVDDGNNQYDSDTDRYIVGDSESWVAVPQGDTVYDLVDNGYNAFESGDGPLTPGVPQYLAAEVRLPGDTGNEAQTDSYVMDLVLYAVQERNNEDFDCQTDFPTDIADPSDTDSGDTSAAS